VAVSTRIRSVRSEVPPSKQFRFSRFAAGDFLDLRVQKDALLWCPDLSAVLVRRLSCSAFGPRGLEGGKFFMHSGFNFNGAGYEAMVCG